ncbi:NUDIX domain-containing protein [Rubrivirga sp. S365]|uniref:NUDIX domain-containing protein n=1 Tax=Rubrivirga litoralis TaxID=3075598 RepID=A0ABU3BPA3_9BACT|nr:MULTISPECIES: NUDIX domain-containing protein [unclassified Rubrivirga]MDT0631124.1 NUDIX domain-containing protein [Rubrivirga sp. F394]MDT7855363.1 NUDIX domain-containing protein [Rubrivirga sp. S365]
MPAVSAHAVDVYPYRHPPSAAGGAEWLVLRRAAGRPDAGAWRMVGGKVEPGEAAWQAALRELAEETGWRPGAGLVEAWALPSVNAFYEWAEDRVVLAPAFAVRVEGEPTLDGEHDGWAWLPAEAAAARLAWPEQARLLRLAARLERSPRPAAWGLPLEHGRGG